MESLGKIFGSKDRVKIMRFFLNHNGSFFDIDYLSEKTLVKKIDARKELNTLTKIAFLTKGEFNKKISKTLKNGKINTSKKRLSGWKLNQRFDLKEPLHTLLLESGLISDKDLLDRFKKLGKFNIFILSGFFLDDEDRKLDILLVGEKLKKDLIDKEIALLESEFGRSISYSVFGNEEFEYRITMYDKLIRDVMENNHKKLIFKKN